MSYIINALLMTALFLIFSPAAFSGGEPIEINAEACQEVLIEDFDAWFASQFSEFKQIDHRFIERPEELVALLENKNAAILFVDYSNRRELTLAIGILKKIRLEVLENRNLPEGYEGHKESKYYYEIQLADGTIKTIEAEAIRKFKVRIDLQSTSPIVEAKEKFSSHYRDWEKHRYRQIDQADIGKKVAFLITDPFQWKFAFAIEGTIESVEAVAHFEYDFKYPTDAPRGWEKRGRLSEKIAMYTIRMLDGSLEKVDSQIILESRVRTRSILILR